MKRILLTFLLGMSLTSWSQCINSVSANDTTICLGDSVTLIASGPGAPLTTTFAGGNNHRGNMFDIVAINTITIESFDAHPMANTDYEIYYRVGTYVGSETNAAAWTQIGTATSVIAQPMGTPTPIPISIGVTIPAGQTYSFYVTSTNVTVGQNYTDGTAPGAVYASDANIQFLEGAGMEYPFAAGGALFSPRIFNGNINYSIGTTYAWNSGETTAQIDVAPIVETTYYVDITSNGCPTTTDSITIYMNAENIVDLGADTAVCPGAQVTIDAGIGQTTYNWNNTAVTSQTITAIPDTTYFIEVMNADGCYAYDSIVVSTSILPEIELGVDTVICGGTTLLLDAGGWSVFDWNTGDTTQTINVGAGSYSVFVTNQDGCTGSSDINILESNAPSVDLGNDITICVNETLTFDAGSGFSSYSWSTSESTQTVVADGSILGVGTHTISVEVSDALGCTDIDEVIVNVDGCVGLIQIEESRMQVYPNPTSDLLNIEIDELLNQTIVNIYSSNGVLVLSEAMSTQTHVLDLSVLAKGSYILELNADDYREIIKLIKD